VYVIIVDDGGIYATGRVDLDTAQMLSEILAGVTEPSTEGPSDLWVPAARLCNMAAVQDGANAPFQSVVEDAHHLAAAADLISEQPAPPQCGWGRAHPGKVVGYVTLARSCGHPDSRISKVPVASCSGCLASKPLGSKGAPSACETCGESTTVDVIAVQVL
jgi:hypothetical protein